MKSRNWVALATASWLALAAAGAFAQTIKIGFITSYSGLNGNLGPYMERGARLYLKEHQKELPPGVNIEFLIRDDTGPYPDKAKQLAQELIVRDKVQLLTGMMWTPNALAMEIADGHLEMLFTSWRNIYRSTWTSTSGISRRASSANSWGGRVRYDQERKCKPMGTRLPQ